MEKEIQVKPMVIPPIASVKVNKTELVYDLPAGDDTYIVTLPVWGYAKYYINWGDGKETQIITDDTNDDNFPSKTLAAGRKYTIKIWGKIWRYGNSGVDSNEYLIEVKKIGPLNLTYAFHQAINLVKVPKRLPRGVYDLSYMFQNCYVFNQQLDKWDVSSVSNMAGMFVNATNFNQPLDKWDVSSVTNMAGMFSNAKNFNQPLDKWDVSSVENMEEMFAGATSFNQPLNNWDVSNVTNMITIFGGATSFNQPLNNWDVSNVTVFLDMFIGAISFNQPLNHWNVSNVGIMTQMFKNATSFNQPLNNWNVSNVINMSSMFANAISFNQPLHDWNWTNISSANMSSMLDNCGMSQYNFQLTLVGWYNIFSTLPIPETSKHFGAKGLVYNPARIIVNLVEDTPVYANDNSWFVADDAIAVNFDL